MREGKYLSYLSSFLVCSFEYLLIHGEVRLLVINHQPQRRDLRVRIVL